MMMSKSFANVAQLSKACRALLRPKLLSLKPKWRFEQLTKDQYSEWDEWGEDKGLSIYEIDFGPGIVLEISRNEMDILFRIAVLVCASRQQSFDRLCVSSNFPDQQVMVQRVF